MSPKTFGRKFVSNCLVTALSFSFACALPSYAQQDSFQRYFDSGKTAAQEGRYVEAQAAFLSAMTEAEKFGAQDQRLSNSLKELAEVFRKRGKYDEARPLYLRALTIDDLTFGPESNEVANDLKQLASIYRQEGKFDDAEAMSRRYQSIEARLSNGEKQEPVDTSNDTLQSAHDLIKADKLSEARAMLRRMMVKDPDNSRIETMLGVVLTTMGDTTDAIPHFKRSIELDKDFPAPYTVLAALYHAQGRIDAAIEILELLRTNCPGTAVADKAKEMIAAIETQKSEPDTIDKAVALAEQFKLTEARDMLVRLLEKDPDNAKAECDLGLVLAEMGQGHDAIKHLKKAIELAPNMPEPRENLGTLYQTQGRLDEAIQAFQALIDRSPSGHIKDKADAAIAMLKKERDRQKLAKSPPDAADYLDHSTLNEPMKWKDADIPIRVYIHPTTNVLNYSESFGVILRKSLDEWTEATKGRIKFKLVDRLEDAQIDCRFTADEKQLSSPAEGAEAIVIPELNGIYKAHVVFLTLSGGERTVSEHGMHFRCLHELGHALGLLGHSPNPSDIMFFSVSLDDNDRTISKRDVATMTRLYSAEVKHAPPWRALGNQAISLLYAKKYHEAIPILEHANRLHPGEQTLIDNLAVAYSLEAVSLMKNDLLDQAEVSLQKAYSLKPGEKALLVTNKISVVVQDLKKLTPSRRKVIIDKIKAAEH